MRGGSGVTALSVGERTTQPVLPVLTTKEPDLNTWWVNTLATRWANATWGDLAIARAAIGAGDLATARGPLQHADRMLLTDGHSLVTRLSSSGPAVQACVPETCEFRCQF